MRLLTFLFLSAMVFYSCQSDASGEEKGVEEVLSESKVGKLENSANRVSPQNTVPADTVNVAKITFEETTHNFGTVKEGEKVEHVYKFKNTGKVPLVITNAKGSCGCTVPDWPEKPIAVGDSGEIKVVFNSNGKPGNQRKTVTVTANTFPTTTRVNIEGVVEADPELQKKRDEAQKERQAKAAAAAANNNSHDHDHSHDGHDHNHNH